MKMMSEKQRRRWGRIRARGKKSYIIRSVVIYILIPIVSPWLFYGLMLFIRSRSDLGSISYGEMIITSFLFGIMGYYRSNRFWSIGEENYWHTIRQDKAANIKDV